MRVLFVGDVVGKPGRQAVRHLLPALRRRHEVDFAVVNLENAAGGFGSPSSVAEPLNVALSTGTVWSGPAFTTGRLLTVTTNVSLPDSLLSFAVSLSV